MTREEQNLADDKVRAEIAHLAAQTARINQQMSWQIPVYLVSFLGMVIAIVKVLPSIGA